jgi:hypothetical protein
MIQAPVVGFTSDNTVMIDLDRMNDHTAVKICQFIVKRWNLGGYLLLNSSRGNYQAIFDRHVNWKSVMSIIFSCAFKYRQNPKLTGWCVMQAIKKSCTLRISNKGKKKPPKIIAQVGTQHRAIKDYLDIRKSLRY